MAKKAKGKDTPMTRWLKSLRAAHGLDQADLASDIGVSRSAVAMWETGTSVPEDMVSEIVKKFPDGPKPPDGPSKEKPFEVSVPGFTASFPKITLRYAGLVPTSDEWGDPLASDIPWEVEAKFDSPFRFVCKVTGESCYPALQQGDVTIWHQDLAPPPGRIVLAQRKQDHGCTVKELAQSADGKNHLVPVNPNASAPPDGDGWGVIARLVGVVFDDEDGTEVSIYRPKGITAKFLLKLRQT